MLDNEDFATHELSATAGTDIELLLAVQRRLDQPVTLAMARGLSHFGEHAAGWLALGLAGAALDRSRRGQWLDAVAAVFTAHAAAVLVKRVVRRPRPHDPRVRIGVGTPSALSMPSAHATSTASAVLAYGELLPFVRPFLPLMLVSRMVLGVHYPSDVVVGATLGGAIGTAVKRIGHARRQQSGRKR